MSNTEVVIESNCKSAFGVGASFGPMTSRPSLSFERSCWEAGETTVVGVDEVGRGAWAGPLTVGAAVVAPHGRVNGIRDSKQLRPHVRKQLFGRIDRWARAWSVGHATPAECDQVGMTEALRLATRRALDLLPVAPDRVLLDGNVNFVNWRPSKALVQGDRRCLSIAAASIMAKVVRDRIMAVLAADFPPYRFESNKGYPAPVHRAALATHGPCAIHRLSWAFAESLPDAEPVPSPAHGDSEAALATYAQASAPTGTTLF
ncbi:ribonuclease HII [Candidatus Poriferisodalis sp.]|uniref:ribonuclease HII n=1 Tax=Candidatus Poriferisodalis sp. TaxID=3101277 RepID=UPI003B0174E0